MHKGKIKDYFPNLPKDTIGLTYSNGIGGRNGKGVSTFMLLTAHNGLQASFFFWNSLVQSRCPEIWQNRRGCDYCFLFLFWIIFWRNNYLFDLRNLDIRPEEVKSCAGISDLCEGLRGMFVQCPKQNALALIHLGLNEVSEKFITSQIIVNVSFLFYFLWMIKFSNRAN